MQLTNHLISVKEEIFYLPGPDGNGRWIFTPTEEEKELVCKRFQNNFRIPQNFVQTAPAYDPGRQSNEVQQECAISAVINPQTAEFCERLGTKKIKVKTSNF